MSNLFPGGGGAIAYSIEKPIKFIFYRGGGGGSVPFAPPPSESAHAIFGSTGCCDKS